MVHLCLCISVTKFLFSHESVSCMWMSFFKVCHGIWKTGKHWVRYNDKADPPLKIHFTYILLPSQLVWLLKANDKFSMNFKICSCLPLLWDRYITVRMCKQSREECTAYCVHTTWLWIMPVYWYYQLPFYTLQPFTSHTHFNPSFVSHAVPACTTLLNICLGLWCLHYCI
jgi:hypothetical protein